MLESIVTIISGHTKSLKVSVLLITCVLVIIFVPKIPLEMWAYQYMSITTLAKTVLKLLSLIIVILMLGISYIFSLRNKLKNPFKDYEPILGSGGAYRHKKDHLPYCGSCILNYHKSMIMADFGSYWLCKNKNCGQNYDNPDYNPPPKDNGPQKMRVV